LELADLGYSPPALDAELADPVNGHVLAVAGAVWPASRLAKATPLSWSSIPLRPTFLGWRSWATRCLPPSSRYIDTLSGAVTEPVDDDLEERRGVEVGDHRRWSTTKSLTMPSP
jgi:hypothetical protein